MSASSGIAATFLRASLCAVAAALGACSDEQPAHPPTPRAEAPATAPETQGGAPQDGARAARPPGDATAPTPSTAREPALAPAPGTVLRETELKREPSFDAPTLARLPAGTRVIAADREGGWLRVINDGREGWVRLLHVSLQPPGTGGGSAQELESVAKLATGRAGTGNIVSTTGIRGLREEQLRAAAPNEGEVARLEGYAATPEAANAYARKHGLARRDVAELPAPKR
ncbi:MAG TPA: SH3 domain-containing protein [Burkholderiales bacterium]